MKACELAQINEVDSSKQQLRYPEELMRMWAGEAGALLTCVASGRDVSKAGWSFADPLA